MLQEQVFTKKPRLSTTSHGVRSEIFATVKVIPKFMIAASQGMVLSCSLFSDIAIYSAG